MSEYKKKELEKIEFRIFKYFIYFFMIILSYKIATAITVSYGIFPPEQLIGLAIFLLGPIYLIVFIPIFLTLSILLIISTKYLFKKISYFQEVLKATESWSNINSSIFWILLGLLPFMSLTYFDNLIEIKKKEGYVNRKEFLKKSQKRNQIRDEKYKKSIQNYTKEQALELIKSGKKILKYLSYDLQKDKEIVYEAVKQDPYDGLKYADRSFRKDKELMIIAVKINGYALCMADDILQRDKEVVLSSINSKQHSREALRCADKNLKKDREIVLASIKNNPSTLYSADESLKKDREIILEAVKRAGYMLKEAHSSLKKDREVVLTALKQSGYALEYVAPSLKDDKEIVLTAIKTNGCALRYATSKQRADKEIVLMAIKHEAGGYDKALRYADTSLLDDKEIALAAVRHNGLSLEYVSKDLKKDREVVLCAIKQNKYAITYAHKQLQDELK